MLKSRKLKGLTEVDFSKKEIRIINLICKQYTTKEIAEKMDLSFRTIEQYRSIIQNKVGARNVIGIVLYAIKFGLYSLKT